MAGEPDRPLPAWLKPGRSGRVASHGILVRYAPLAASGMLRPSDPVPYGANFFVRRDLFERHGLFDEALWELGGRAALGGEDTEFEVRVRDRGEPIGYCREALVVHPVHYERCRLRRQLRLAYDYGWREPLVFFRADRPRFEFYRAPLILRGAAGAVGDWLRGDPAGAVDHLLRATRCLGEAAGRLSRAYRRRAAGRKAAGCDILPLRASVAEDGAPPIRRPAAKTVKECDLEGPRPRGPQSENRDDAALPGGGRQVKRTLTVVLLVAGRGVRLGGDRPKCLTVLGAGGETILDRQLAGLSGCGAAETIAVVGFQEERVRRAHPELRFVLNPRYAETNTAKSLLLALAPLDGTDVLWLNGDVVFDPRIVPLVLGAPRSCMAVNRAKCGEEEIKYRTDTAGNIVEVSKRVVAAEGEAVGINLVRARDLDLFRQCLTECGDQDYFERGLELAIGRGLRLRPVDIGSFPCVEIDFPADLERAKSLFPL